ncbi:hypothetical protein [Mycobacterium sp. PS03-16]|uniref:hypothetical protein n=1 Tax=Mycobacterium sp. PS03-16 TaxID=2559611 RepID=UPI001FD76875|nr:hypothetical protein [Mycobacterium sp. PS03-16]
MPTAWVVEIVRSSGGWLFDRSTAGWDVAVLVGTADVDPLPLQILGASVVTLDRVAERFLPHRNRPRAFAVADDLYTRDSRIRHGVRSVLAQGDTEVTVWGAAPLTASVVHGYLPYCPSVAARAFKLHALAAAGQRAASACAIEIYRNRLE